MRRFASLLALTLALPLVGPMACATDDLDPDEVSVEGDATGLDKADHAALPITKLSAAVGLDRRERGGTLILTSAAAWELHMGTAAPADVDFATEWVAFFGTGLKSTGGFDAGISELTLSPSLGALIVSTRESSPGLNCRVTRALTTPHAVVKFKRPSPRPTYALAARASELRDCSNE